MADTIDGIATLLQSCATPMATKAEATGLPSGCIVFWSGTIATIPAGWYLCDGTNGTPDLRNQFIVGAYADDSGVAKTKVTGSFTQTGGSTTGAIAAHSITQPVVTDHVVTQPAIKNHTMTDPTFKAHSNHTTTAVKVPTSGTTVTAVTGAAHDNNHAINTSTLIDAHSFSTNVAIDAHTLKTNVAVADHAAVSILNPYYALAYIMKS
jgi:hypothetical protein